MKATGFIQSERTQTLVTSRGISALYKVLLLNGVLNLGLPFPSQVDNQPDNVHYHGNHEEQELKPSCVLMRRVGKGNMCCWWPHKSIYLTDYSAQIHKALRSWINRLTSITVHTHTHAHKASKKVINKPKYCWPLQNRPWWEWSLQVERSHYSLRPISQLPYEDGTQRWYDGGDGSLVTYSLVVVLHSRTSLGYANRKHYTCDKL